MIAIAFLSGSQLTPTRQPNDAARNPHATQFFPDERLFYGSSNNESNLSGLTVKFDHYITIKKFIGGDGRWTNEHSSAT
jgi:hypothetical protein